jgi:hypothetical protein
LPMLDCCLPVSLWQLWVCWFYEGGGRTKNLGRQRTAAFAGPLDGKSNFGTSFLCRCDDDRKCTMIA